MEEIALVPVHLCMPYSEKVQEMLQGMITEEELLNDYMLRRDHPLGYQTELLRRRLEEEFGSGMNKKPLIMGGDFNFVPKYRLETLHYKTISSCLTDSFKGRGVTSWPTPSSRERMLTSGDWQLDHIFFSCHFQAVTAEILPLKGSDHYPIYLSIRER